jgi:hypothetical protein
MDTIPLVIAIGYSFWVRPSGIADSEFSVSVPTHPVQNTIPADGVPHVHAIEAPHFMPPEDKGEKYVKRKGRLQSLLEQYVPGMRVPPTLPVTRRYIPFWA